MGTYKCRSRRERESFFLGAESPACSTQGRGGLCTPSRSAAGHPLTCSNSSTVYLEGKAGGGGGLALPLSWQATGMLFTERPVL